MRRIRSGCCARTASGHVAAALPISVMNSRRCMCPLRTRLVQVKPSTLSRGARGEMAHNRLQAQCPLWVKSRHHGSHKLCPLYPQKQTYTWPAPLARQGNVLRFARLRSAPLALAFGFFRFGTRPSAFGSPRHSSFHSRRGLRRHLLAPLID